MTKSDVDVALTLEGTRRQRPRQTAECAWGYFLILPALLLMALVIGVPLVKAVGISLTNSTCINPVPTFVGLRNIAVMVQTPIFWEVVRTSLIWTGTVVLAQLICGFASALLLNLRFRGRGLARALIILPWVCPGVIAAIIWRVIDDPYLGPINATLAWDNREVMRAYNLDALVCRLPENVLLLTGYWPLSSFAFALVPREGPRALIAVNTEEAAIPAGAADEVRTFGWDVVSAVDPYGDVQRHLSALIRSTGLERGRIGYE